ncbi:TonB-dependent receptor [Sphingomonas sp. RB56-2]|uniref:TonB-dependent receptor n=1 Tax=Sphingomonas brevis TaxID=2908206 RepID=A0ABT0S9H4_9SPHN|nr:TonB-dependent receptor [Sphingomonas brevis]MCL6740789.1 TonB-dependent receptor [Sphingomonas brevis]
MMRKLQRLQVLLFSSALFVAQGAMAQQAAGPPAPDQEPAAETAAEGDAKAQGEPAVPTSQGLEPADDRSLSDIVVVGSRIYRNRTDTIAPELTFGQEFFQKFEPTSVGDSLKRVPGVAFTSDIGEYDAPALRGLGAGFTQILVNGRPIPGAGNDRSVFVDRIPAEIIDRIEIIRSPTADLDSQGIGGTINIILKDGTSLPPGLIARAGLLFYPDDNTFKGSGAVSWSGRNQAETVAWSLTVDAQQRYNPKLARQEVFDDNSPGFEDSENGLDLFRPFDRDGSIAVERTEELDTRRSFDLSLNGDITFLLGEQSKLRFDGFLIRTRRTDTEQTLELERPEDDEEDPILDEGWEIDSTQVAKEPFKQLNYGLSGLYETKWGDGMSAEVQVRYSQFDEESSNNTYELDDDLFDLDTLEAEDLELTDDAELIEIDALDILDKEFSGDASIKKQWANWSIKAGIAGKLKRRTFGQIIGEDLNDDEDASIVESEFKYRESRLDGFALAEFKLGGQAKMQAGVRAEYTKSKQKIRQDLTEADEESASANEFHLNPSVHFQLPFGSGTQFRASLAKTVRRPNVDQVVPFQLTDDPEDNDITVGNPELKFETSWGVDIGLEQRLPRGVVGVNFFYRKVRDLISLVNTGVPVFPEEDPDSDEGRARIYTYDNVGNGKVYGFEFDLSAPLSFIGLDDTGVFANYTRIWSKRTEPNTGMKVSFDGQPKYVYNFGVTQEIPSWGMSGGFSFRKQGKSVSTFLGEEESQTYQGNLEAYVEKRFGKNFVLRLSANNILDARSRQWERNFDGDTGLEIIENQQAGDVDNFEVEHEETSPQVMLTARLVF